MCINSQYLLYKLDKININILVMINMNKNIEHIIVSFLVGIFFGILMGITIKYPVELSNIEKYQQICGKETIERVKINIVGDVYYVKCSNGIEVKVH